MRHRYGIHQKDRREECISQRTAHISSELQVVLQQEVERRGRRALSRLQRNISVINGVPIVAVDRLCVACLLLLVTLLDKIGC